MVVVRIKGGLGNQLFQYAAGYALAHRLGEPLFIDASFFPKQTLRNYRISSLNPTYNEMIEATTLPLGVKLYKNKYINKAIRQSRMESLYAGKFQFILERDHSDITEVVLQTNKRDIYLDGYFQSAIYFQSVIDDLKDQFVPSYVISPKVRDVKDEICACNSVSIHVRRGDFLAEKDKGSTYHYVLNQDYYFRAIEFISQRVEAPVFYWFSNDIDWVISTFGQSDNFRFVKNAGSNADVDDMLLMNYCKHNIVANSTFSWWGAFLNRNSSPIQIVPKRPFGGGHMIPDEWIKL